MNENLILVFVTTPIVLTLALGVVKLLTRSNINVPVKLRLAKFSENELAFDWAIHFSIGGMFVAVFTVTIFLLVDHQHAAVGIFSGIAASLLAYVVARPPIRDAAQNPEFDRAVIAASLLVHVLMGVLVASALTFGSAN